MSRGSDNINNWTLIPCQQALLTGKTLSTAQWKLEHFTLCNIWSTLSFSFLLLNYAIKGAPGTQLDTEHVGGLGPEPSLSRPPAHAAALEPGRVQGAASSPGSSSPACPAGAQRGSAPSTCGREGPASSVQQRPAASPAAGAEIQPPRGCRLRPGPPGPPQGSALASSRRS